MNAVGSGDCPNEVQLAESLLEFAASTKPRAPALSRQGLQFLTDMPVSSSRSPQVCEKCWPIIRLRPGYRMATKRAVLPDHGLQCKHHLI